MTFLGFKYVGGRNSNAKYIEVKKAAQALINAKKRPNANAGKQEAVNKALKQIKKLKLNIYYNRKKKMVTNKINMINVKLDQLIEDKKKLIANATQTG